MASGLVGGIVAGLRRDGRLPEADPRPPSVPRTGGRALIVAGSCSEATRAQVSSFATTHDIVRLDPRLADPPTAAIGAARRLYLRGARAVLVASTAGPDEVDATSEILGPEAGSWIEHWLAEVAAALAGDGVRRFIVAGGETAGAVVEALKVRSFEVGAELAPGVPVLTADRPGGRLVLIAKSGNFGGPDFFAEALAATELGVDATTDGPHAAHLGLAAATGVFDG
jgi:uncharacterized protein YgbK (DUF1537 family)